MSEWLLIINYKEGVYRVVSGDRTVAWTLAPDDSTEECLQRLVNAHNDEVHRIRNYYRTALHKLIVEVDV